MLIEKIKIFILPLLIICLFVGLASTISAEELPTNPDTLGTGGRGLDVTAKEAKILKVDAGSRPDIPTVIGTVIGAVLSLLGSLFLFLIVYGGFMWMTAGGNESQVTKAKTILTSSVIGLTIIVFSYALVSIIFSSGEQVFKP